MIMRLLMIAPEQIAVPPPKGGSVEICMYAIALRLSRQHKVTLISRKYANYPSITTKGNLRIIRVPTRTPKQYIRAALNFAKDHKYDWIQIDNRPRFLSPVRKCFPNTSISIFLHSLTFVTEPRISKKLAKEYLNKANVVIANSGSMRKELSTRFPNLSHKIKQVYLGVDLDQFKPPTPAHRALLRKTHGLQSAFVFAFAGRIIPRKGLPLLIKAFGQVRKKLLNVKLIVAGRGKPRYMADLKSKVHRLQVPIQFIGYKSHRRMHEVFGSADCLVCPSQKHEAFGLVNVEAMATGIPVIASNIGGIKEIIRHGKNGLLVKKYRKAEAFASNMLKVAKDRSYADRLGKYARKDVKHRFSWARTTQGLNKLYVK